MHNIKLISSQLYFIREIFINNQKRKYLLAISLVLIWHGLVEQLWVLNFNCTIGVISDTSSSGGGVVILFFTFSFLLFLSTVYYSIFYQMSKIYFLFFF